MLTSVKSSLGAMLDLKLSLTSDCEGEQSDAGYEEKCAFNGLLFCSTWRLLFILRGPGVGLCGVWGIVDKKYC